MSGLYGTGITAGPGALAGIYNPSNPALALFTTASENPTASGLGLLSNSGFSNINFSSVTGMGHGGYTGNMGADGAAPTHVGTKLLIGAGLLLGAGLLYKHFKK